MDLTDGERLAMQSGEHPDNESPPPALGTPSVAAQHPMDHSWMLQLMNDLGNKFSAIEERTDNLRTEVRDLRNDVKGLPTRGSYWSGIALVCAVFLSVAGIFGAMIVVPLAGAINEAGQVLIEARDRPDREVERPEATSSLRPLPPRE